MVIYMRYIYIYYFSAIKLLLIYHFFHKINIHKSNINYLQIRMGFRSDFLKKDN